MRSLLFLVLPLVCLSGCANVCDRMCTAQANLFEECLPGWGTTWEEEGFTDKEAFTDRCLSVWGDGYDSTEQNSSAREDLGQECTSQLQAAEADNDCQTLLD